MAGSRRHQDRKDLGAAGIVSLQVGAGWLPLHDTEAREWLESQGLVRWLAGRRVVIWGDVIERVRAGEAPTLGEEPRKAVRLPRAKL